MFKINEFLQGNGIPDKVVYERKKLFCKVPVTVYGILVDFLEFIDFTPWIKFDKNDLNTYPKNAGRYLIYRKKCDKTHFEQWNGTGWSSSMNDCTHYKKVKRPRIDE